MTTRLDAIQKRELRSALAAAEGALPDQVTCERVQAVAAALKLDVDQDAAQSILAEFGYAPSADIQHEPGNGDSIQTSVVWRLAPAPKPLTQQQRAVLLDERLGALMRVFLEDVLQDPMVSFATLPEVANETARVFATSLGAVLAARAPRSAKTILSGCADTVGTTMRGAVARLS